TLRPGDLREMRADDKTVVATIVDLTHEGLGVADIGGQRAFVPDALPGERVELVLRQRRRHMQRAEPVRGLEPSPQRTAQGCEYFGRCGGCARPHLAHDAQVRFKQEAVSPALARIGRVTPEEWLPPATGPIWRYRRRARLGVKQVAAKKRVLVGFRERCAPYITDMLRCPVLAPPLDGLLEELATLIHSSSVRERIPQIEAAVADHAVALVFRVLDPPSEADRAAL